MKITGGRPRVVVSGDGRGVVGHAGARLVADVADVTGLTGRFSVASAGLSRRRRGHDPSRVAVGVAVMLADGGEAISDLAVLRDQPGLFGAVASDPTAWRLLSDLDAAGLARLRAARAAAREIAWAQAGEGAGGLPASRAAGRAVPGLVLDLDATVVVCHSEKEQAAPTWKHTFGYHPLLCFLDNTREALAGLLRPGNAGSDTAADHITVLDRALGQIPDAVRHGSPILVRSDAAGCTKEFPARIRGLRDQHLDTRFSVGAAVGAPVRAAVGAARVWIPALDGNGDVREGAEVCEITGLLDTAFTAGYPAGTRFPARREDPRPGAQLSLFDTVNGMRHRLIATDSNDTDIQYLEARHRAHARVEDRIRTGKDTGFGRFPSREYAINQAWLELALTGIDLLAWTRLLLLDGDLASAEPRKRRYRLPHVPARISRTARRTRLRIAAGRPWTDQLAQAFSRLAALPQHIT